MKSNLKKFLMETVSKIILAAFVYTIVFAPVAEASFWMDRTHAIRENNAEKTQVENILAQFVANTYGLDMNGNPDAAPIAVPQQLGSVVDFWKPKTESSYPLVIHIQDAHNHYAAQKNSAAILKLLSQAENRAGQPVKVYVEGASERVSTEWLKVLPNKFRRNETAEQLLKAGQLTGEQYLSIVEGAPLILQGTENESWYKANLQTRYMVDDFRNLLVSEWNQNEARLVPVKERIYSQAMQKFDKEHRAFADENVSVEDYVSYLLSAWKGNLSDPRYENISHFKELIALEKTFNTDRVQNEAQNLIAFLSSKLDPTSSAQLADLALAYRSSQISGEKYFGLLVSLADVYKRNIPQLKSYVGYLDQSARIHNEGLFSEIRSLEKEVGYQLVGSDAASKKLFELSQAVTSYRLFWQEKLSPEAWQDFAVSRDYRGWTQKKIGAAIASYEKELALNPITYPYLRGIDTAKLEYVQDSYYRLALRRNRPMIENMVTDFAKMQDKNPVVLIAGGFHTPDMLRLMRQNNVPYVVVRPNLDLSEAAVSNLVPEQTDAPRFETIAQVKKAWLKNLSAVKSDNAVINKQISKAIDLLENRLEMEGPLSSNGRTYFKCNYKTSTGDIQFNVTSGRASQAAFISPQLEKAFRRAHDTVRGDDVVGDPNARGAAPSLASQVAGLDNDNGIVVEEKIKSGQNSSGAGVFLAADGNPLGDSEVKAFNAGARARSIGNLQGNQFLRFLLDGVSYDVSAIRVADFGSDAKTKQSNPITTYENVDGITGVQSRPLHAFANVAENGKITLYLTENAAKQMGLLKADGSESDLLKSGIVNPDEEKKSAVDLDAIPNNEVYRLPSGTPVSARTLLAHELIESAGVQQRAKVQVNLAKAGVSLPESFVHDVVNLSNPTAPNNPIANVGEIAYGTLEEVAAGFPAFAAVLEVLTKASSQSSVSQFLGDEERKGSSIETKEDSSVDSSEETPVPLYLLPTAAGANAPATVVRYDAAKKEYKVTVFGYTFNLGQVSSSFARAFAVTLSGLVGKDKEGTLVQAVALVAAAKKVGLAQTAKVLYDSVTNSANAVFTKSSASVRSVRDLQSAMDLSKQPVELLTTFTTDEVLTAELELVQPILDQTGQKLVVYVAPGSSAEPKGFDGKIKVIRNIQDYQSEVRSQMLRIGYIGEPSDVTAALVDSIAFMISTASLFGGTISDPVQFSSEYAKLLQVYGSNDAIAAANITVDVANHTITYVKVSPTESVANQMLGALLAGMSA